MITLQQTNLCAGTDNKSRGQFERTFNYGYFFFKLSHIWKLSDASIMIRARDKNMRQLLITTNSSNLDQKCSICNVIAHLICFLDKINTMWCSVKLGQPKTYQVLKNVSGYSCKIDMTTISKASIFQQHTRTFCTSKWHSVTEQPGKQWKPEICPEYYFCSIMRPKSTHQTTEC